MSNRTRIFLVVAATLISIALIWPNIGTRTVRVYLKEDLNATDREKSFTGLDKFLTANYTGKYTWAQKTGIKIEAEEKKEESTEKSTAKEETYLAVQGNFVQTAFLNELSRQWGVDPARVTLEPMWVEKKVKAKPFKLGLDLQGGMNLVLKGDFAKLEEQVRRQYPDSFFEETNKLLAAEKDEEKKKNLQNKLDSAKRALDFSDERKQQDIEGALEIIRSRIDSTGVSEPLIRLHGNDRIEVSLPGVASPEQAKRVISSTARVAYHIHDPRGDAGRFTSEASKSFPEFELLETEFRRQEFIRNLEKTLNLPKNLGIYVYYERRADEKGKVALRPANFLVVENEPALTGEAMSRNVYANFDADRMQHTVDFELTSDGRDKFAKITTDNKGKQLAIVIDGRIRSAPSINEPITGGSAQISGSFSQQEAKDLALIIKEGALPVPMVIDEERSVGPTLGKEAIEKGVKAIMLGLLFVVIYMVLYYHGAGLIANVALVFNVLFMAAIFALLDFTITLPGLAGVVLTLGMAVDANVIIYERIREELARGKSLKNAVSAGFERATLTILDANLTTLIVAVLLASKLGAGPIKGFGVTLFIGIISTLFTALVMTRAVIEGLVFSLNVKSLSLGFGKHRKAGKLRAAEGVNMIFPFMKLKWFNIVGSLIALVGVMVLTYAKYGGFALGLDFAGGIKIEVVNNDKINIESIRNFLSQEKIEGTVQKADKTSQDLLKLEIGGQSQQTLTAAAEKEKAKLEAKGLTANSLDFLRYKLAEKLAGADMEKVIFASQNLVGPTVGKYMRSTALYLITAALILITIYVAFRFKLNYAVGALFSSLHDLVLTIGVIGLLQIPLSIPVVAALMTILGYSINDTIVIFDRIRENSSGQEELGMDKIVDKSIMQTLTRTMNTTTTTLLAIIPIYILGDEGLRDLATVLIFGILIGTYSSNFVASPIVVIWDNFVKRRKA